VFTSSGVFIQNFSEYLETMRFDICGGLSGLLSCTATVIILLDISSHLSKVSIDVLFFFIRAHAVLLGAPAFSTPGDLHVFTTRRGILILTLVASEVLVSIIDDGLLLSGERVFLLTSMMLDLVALMLVLSMHGLLLFSVRETGCGSFFPFLFLWHVLGWLSLVCTSLFVLVDCLIVFRVDLY
jgi:hypothetical protein